MAWPSCAREDAEEWIDRLETPSDDIHATLRDQAWVNRWLGGANAALAHALPLLGTCSSAPIRVLDLACGGADISRRLVDEARRLGKVVEVTALDQSRPVLDYAQRMCANYPEISLVQGDALSPPLNGGPFDLVLLTTFLHHLPPDKVILALTRAAEHCRGTVIAVDLVRSSLASLGFALVARLAGFHSISVHDGAVSVRRSYTTSELAGLARQAGLPEFRLHCHSFYRMALVYNGSGA